MIGRYLSLAFLSAITAEFLLGDQWLSGGTIVVTTQLAELVLYAAFYGSAAVLIRELARRTGHGWPTILLLALAFGFIEEGIVDESLFNANFVGEHLLRFGFIPALGIAGPWTIFVLSLHVIWSVGSPIAIAEAIYATPLFLACAPIAPQEQAAMAARAGNRCRARCYSVGAGFAIFQTLAGKHFLGSPLGSLIATTVATAVLIVVALLIPRRSPRATRPLGVAAAIGVVTTSAYVVLDRIGGGLSPMAGRHPCTGASGERSDPCSTAATGRSRPRDGRHPDLLLARLEQGGAARRRADDRAVGHCDPRARDRRCGGAASAWSGTRGNIIRRLTCLPPLVVTCIPRLPSKQDAVKPTASFISGKEVT